MGGMTTRFLISIAPIRAGVRRMFNPSESDPDARMPDPAPALEDVMALDPRVPLGRTRRYHLDDFRRHGRNLAANVMTRHPDPGGAAPGPMPSHPGVTDTRGGDDLHARRGHRPLADHDRHLGVRGDRHEARAERETKQRRSGATQEDMHWSISLSSHKPPSPLHQMAFPP